MWVKFPFFVADQKTQREKTFHQRLTHIYCDSRMHNKGVQCMDSEALLTSLMVPISSIIPDRLFLGNQTAAEDVELLKRHGITHIVQCTAVNRNPFPAEFTYLTLVTPDVPSHSLAESFELSHEFIHNALHSNPQHRVLVHCLAGASRSPSIVIAYLMRTTNISFNEALTLLQTIRPIVDPNTGFRRQLEDYGRKLIDLREAELDRDESISQFQC